VLVVFAFYFENSLFHVSRTRDKSPSPFLDVLCIKPQSYPLSDVLFPESLNHFSPQLLNPDFLLRTFLVPLPYRLLERPLHSLKKVFFPKTDPTKALLRKMSDIWRPR